MNELNNNYEDEEIDPEEENYNLYNSNNSNDIEYQMDNNNQINNDYMAQSNQNFKENEDIKIKNSKININGNRYKEVDINK